MTISKPTTASDWHAALPLDEVPKGTMAVWKMDGLQVLLSHAGEGEVFAVDNRCPHEGYPLISGDLKGTALTCSWHNWKFDVRTGACKLGEEGVRSFGARVRDGVIEVDLAEPDPCAAWPELLASFDVGLGKHQVARCARDGLRLLNSGYDPHVLLSRVALFDARHAEYGSTHASAVAADCGRFFERYPGPEAMVAMAPAIDMCGDANRRQPRRERPAAVPGATEEALRAAVDAEEVERALGLLRGAFEQGVERKQIDAWMFAVLSDHFLNFGHALIYMVKLQELLERAGDQDAGEIYEGLLFHICLGTREDTLPYMKGYFRRFDDFVQGLPVEWKPGSGAPDSLLAAVTDEVVGGDTKRAVESVTLALQAGASLAQVAGALVIAAATRLLRFNVAIDSDPSVVETWLFATHRLTFAAAVRQTIERFDGPLAVRFLFQATAFIHSGRAMDLDPPPPLPEPREMTMRDVLNAVAQRRPEDAMAGARALLGDPTTRRELREALEDQCLRDPLVRPIVVVHAIKTVVVAFEEYEDLAGTPDRELTVLATLRFLASPIQERRVHEAVRRSMDWVGEGKMPRKLTQ